jgi:hypothetical protein
VHQVLWVDLLTKQEFEAGFGSHTPIYSGQTKCVRYYMNFGRALAVFKEVLLRDGRGFDAHNIAGVTQIFITQHKILNVEFNI